jgi:guanylate kinase
VAKQEVASFTEYDYIVVNDHIEAAVKRLQHVVLAERSRLNRMGDAAESIVRTFHD